MVETTTKQRVMQSFLIIHFFLKTGDKGVFIESAPFRRGYARFIELQNSFGKGNVTYKTVSPLTITK